MILTKICFRIWLHFDLQTQFTFCLGYIIYLLCYSLYIIIVSDYNADIFRVVQMDFCYHCVLI